MVVGVRARLRPLEHGPKVQHRSLPPPYCRSPSPQSNNLDDSRGDRNLRCILLLPLRAPMPTICLLLDAIHWRKGNVYQSGGHSRCHLRLLSDLLRRGLDSRYHSRVLGLEFTDESKDQAGGRDDFSCGRYVSLPTPLLTPRHQNRTNNPPAPQQQQ